MTAIAVNQVTIKLYRITPRLEETFSLTDERMTIDPDWLAPEMIHVNHPICCVLPHKGAGLWLSSSFKLAGINTSLAALFKALAVACVSPFSGR